MSRPSSARSKARKAGSRRPKTGIFDKLALPDERLPVLVAFGHLKSLSLALRPQGYPEETQARVKALLPKVAVVFAR